jgi:hypothetical protein
MMHRANYFDSQCSTANSLHRNTCIEIEARMGMFRASLTQEAYDREYSNSELLRRIALYFRPWLGRLLWISTLVTMMSLLGVALPIVIANGVERLVGSDDNSTVITSTLVALVLGLGIANWVVNQRCL